MSGIRKVGKPVAVVSALGLGGTYVILAGTAGLVLTGLVLPSTKSARGIVTEKQVHDFRQSLGAAADETEAAQPVPPVQPGPPVTNPAKLNNAAPPSQTPPQQIIGGSKSTAIF